MLSQVYTRLGRTTRRRGHRPWPAEQRSINARHRHDGAVPMSAYGTARAPLSRSPTKFSASHILPAPRPKRPAAQLQSVFISCFTIVRTHVSGTTFGRIDARPDQTEICEARCGMTPKRLCGESACSTKIATPLIVPVGHRTGRAGISRVGVAMVAAL